MRRRFAACLALTCLLALSFVSNTGHSASAQTIKGPVSDTIKFTQYTDENIALKAVKSGDIDAYLYRIPVELVSDARHDPSLSVYDRDAGSFGMLINPAPSNDSNTINPFQFREIRFAMNYVVDRDFTVNEILKGSGAPMIDPFGISSPEYLNVADIVESFGFRHDLATANKTIDTVLSTAGASMQNGKWIYKGSPISIKFFIRSDDVKRQAIGEAIASDLEKLGFTVDRVFGDLARAQLDVYGSNPQDLKWQLYTEGYAGTALFDAYNPTVTAQMYAPWFGNMPGRGNAGTWQYSNNTLDDITEKIMNFNFTSQQQRTQLVRQAVEQGIQESVRIFIAQTKDSYVASSSVKGLVNDFGAGISSRFSLIDAQADNRSTLNIGVRNIQQGAWNLPGGLKDTFTITIAAPVYDYPTLRDPYLGTVIPGRDNWTDITTKGPSNYLSVPSDAFKWDPFSQTWKSVGNGTQAKSEVTYKILYSNWHNGIPMDQNDLLYSYYFGFQWGINSTAPNKPDLTYDPEITPQIAAQLPELKGIKFNSNGTVTSYVDAWHYDPREIADFSPVWASEPWEITAAQERIVTSGKVSFSSSGASEKGIDWLSLVNPAHAKLLQAELQKMKNENFIPPPLQGKVSIADADKRYDASIKWISDHNHAVISNGPFYLDTFNAEGQTATLKAFRDPSYPFAQDYWSSKFGVPKIASIGRIDVNGPINAGNSTTINVGVNVAGEPSNDALVRYFLIGDKGVVAQGNASSSTPPGTFAINLYSNATKDLASGAYTLKVIAIGNQAYKPAFGSTPVRIINVPEFGSQLALFSVASAISAVVVATRIKKQKSLNNKVQE